MDNDDDDGPVCPNCFTGVLQPAGDMGGHLICSVCFAQSQDVVLEQVDAVMPGDDTTQHRLATSTGAERPLAVVKAMDVQEEAMVYLKCLQRLLRAQEKVIVNWFQCDAYAGVLKQIWKLTALKSGLLDLRNLPTFITPAQESEEERSGMESDEDRLEPVEGLPRKRLRVQCAGDKMASVLFMLTHKLSLLTTLACHLLTAWILKLPIWASDVWSAARCSQVPFTAAVELCNDQLDGHPVARRALRTNQMRSPSALVNVTHKLASAINVVVPELNLGAFVLRHCASLGLPVEVAGLARHLALARKVDTRKHGLALERYLPSWEGAQKVQVLLPILAICKHVLKCAAVPAEERGEVHVGGRAQDWVQAGQRLLELKQLHQLQRLQMALQNGVHSVLESAYGRSNPDCAVPQVLAKAHQSLLEYANDLEKAHDSWDEFQEDWVGCCGDVMADSNNKTDVAAQMYAQLLRITATEMGFEVTTVDNIATTYFQELGLV